ncbi:glycosyltransferase (plasmid) [Cupriavidus necator]|nr:glycosyltransferase [Cupriavidus necator]
MGNDVHRDWTTLIEAVKDQRDFDLKIVSRTITSASLGNATNISVEEAHNVERIRQLYGEADVVVVPLLSNQHASGITVVLEAVALGKPVVCARVGGIDAYFAENEIQYYECGNARSLRNALRELCGKRNARDQAERAQRRFRIENYSSEGYARRTLMCLEENT